MKPIKKQSIAKQRKIRVRSKVSGTKVCPRACVRVSLTGISVQLIDDEKGVTLISQADKALKGTRVEKAAELGKAIAKSAVDKGIKKAVLDRGSKKYHGRIKALADAMRDTGLTI